MGQSFEWYALFIAVALSLAITEAVRRVAVRHSILDHPNERSSHTIPTPFGGGIAIVGVTIAGLLAGAMVLHLESPRLLTIVVCGIAVAAVSWLDDLRHVPQSVRLAVHLGAGFATAWIVRGPVVFSTPFTGTVHIGSALALAIETIWIAGLTNAFNFMDGIDGIAALQATLAGLAWALAGAILQNDFFTLIGFLLAGSGIGFLFENWQPARIFMGDVGSAFLGYVLASLAVFALRDGVRFAVAGALFVWPFLFDAGFTLLRRIVRRERILDAHRSHLYQRLVIGGMSHTETSLAYGLLALVGVGAGVTIAAGVATAPALAGVAAAALLLLAAVRWREARASHSAANRISASSGSTTGT